MSLSIRVASPADTPLILQFIRDLADYERLLHEVAITEADDPPRPVRREPAGVL